MTSGNRPGPDPVPARSEAPAGITAPNQAHVPTPVPFAGPASAAPQIRPAEPGDLASVLDLLGAAILPRAGVEEQFGDGYSVAVEAGRIVGAAGVERYGTNGLLRSVVVDADLRGRGVGEALVRDRIAWTADAGLEALYLLTTTAPGFFARLGFEVIERNRAPAPVKASAEFASICPGDAVAMTLRLAHTNSPPIVKEETP